MLESKITELTAAVQVLTETIQALGALAQGSTTTPVTGEPKGCPSARADEDAAEPEVNQTEVTITEVREALLAIPKAEAKRILREYDVERLPDLHSDAYPSVIRDAQKVAA